MACDLSPLHFITRYCHTLHFDAGPPHAELIPDWEYVRELVAALDTYEDLLVHKSRKVLFSWIVMAHFVHALRFRKEMGQLVISRKERAVDDGGPRRSTPDSLFGKARYIWRNLPWWMKTDDLTDVFLMLHRERSGAFIKGESTESDASRSGTYSRIFIDETPFIDHSETIFRAARFASPHCVIMGGSPKGKANVHARLRHTPGHGGFKLVTIHWSRHPLRTPAWYAKESASLLPHQVASELDLSDSDSVGGRVYAVPIDHRGSYPFDPELETIVSWDFGMGDETVALVWQRTPEGIFLRDCVHGSDKAAVEYDAELKALYPKTAREWADPSGNSRDSAGGSWITNLQKCGRPIMPVEPIEYEDHDGKRVRNRNKVEELSFARQNFLPRVFINTDTAGGAWAADMLDEYHFPTNEEGDITGYMPVHDRHSHYGDAFTYAAMGELGSSRFQYDDFEKHAAIEQPGVDYRAYEERDEDDDRRIWGEP